MPQLPLQCSAALEPDILQSKGSKLVELKIMRKTALWEAQWTQYWSPFTQGLAQVALFSFVLSETSIRICNTHPASILYVYLSIHWCKSQGFRNFIDTLNFCRFSCMCSTILTFFCRSCSLPAVLLSSTMFLKTSKILE